MAELEWYDKHKKDITAAVRKGQTAPPDGGIPCTLVKMKDGPLLCAHVSPSKAQALVKEAKGQGGKVLSEGTLFRGEDGFTFGVTNGSAAVKALLVAAIAEVLGSPLKVHVVALEAPGETEAPPAPSAPPAGGDKAQFAELLRRISPRYQQAVAAAPPNKAVLEKSMGMALAAAKASDYGKSVKVLQALDATLQKAPPAVPPAPPLSDAQLAALRQALAKMVLLVRDAAAANPARKADLLQPLSRCQDHLKNGNAAEFKATLLDLNRALKEINSAAAPDQKAAGTVAVWVQARDAAITQVQGLQAVLVKVAKETGQSDFDLIAKKGLGGITQRLQVGLHVALFEFDQAAGAARAAARTKAAKVVAEFKTFLASNALIKVIEKNPWSVKVQLRAVLGPALDQLDKMLAA